MKYDGDGRATARFFSPTKEVADGSVYPAMRGMALWGFSYVAFVPCAGGAVPPS